MMKILLKTVCIITICAIAFSAFTFCVAAEQKKYVRGDSDGDGTVSIYDVTLIQRVIAGIEPDPDGMITKRGDVNKNGMDINDAVNIQKYLAQFNNVLGIGNTVTDGGNWDLPFVSD